MKQLAFWAMLFFLFTPLANADVLKLSGVNIDECKKNYCVTLSSPRVSQGQISKIYAFKNSVIQVNDKNKQKKHLFVGFSGSYNMDKGLYFLSKGDKEVLIDSINQVIIEF